MAEREASADPGPVPAQTLPRRPLRKAAALFAVVTLALAAMVAASAALGPGVGVLLDPGTAPGLDPRARFNGVYVLLIAFTAAMHRLEQALGTRELDALVPVVEAPAARWRSWRERIATPPLPRLAGVCAAGALFGIGLHVLGDRVGRAASGSWVGHDVWGIALAGLLFALLVPMGWLSVRRARVYGEVGRHVRVRFPAPAGLESFARVGLRGAAAWLIGSSIASLLFLDARAAGIVLAVMCVTLGIAVAALLLPSRGVHERLREAKAAELAWTRRELARTREALARPDASGADLAALPALVAWEARIADEREWPFDASTWLRFALVLLVPLGSWSGGALVEHVIDSVLD